MESEGSALALAHVSACSMEDMGSIDMLVLARRARDASPGNVTTMVGAGASHAIHHFRAQRRETHDR